MIGAVVIGAGVVGLAVGRRLALAGLNPLVLDAEAGFGTGTSSRNSEVIHAGLYYSPGTIKAVSCVRGKRALYDYCERRGIPHKRLGKLIVATSGAEVERLDEIEARARACDVPVTRLSGAAAQRLEPELACVEALHSPTTGIIDSHAFMLALLGDLESNGGQYVGRARVTRIDANGSEWQLHVNDEPAVSVPLIVNAAGLEAQQVAGLVEAISAAFIPRRHLARGRYFSVSGRVGFQRLIYPVPVDGGLGVHLTLDMAGRARLGPDVTWVDRPDYEVDAGEAPRFAHAARRFWPGLTPDRLSPDYAGVRPKISGPGEPPGDFVISGPGRHGVRGVVNLFGIESPGLTASLALADMVWESACEAPQRAAA